MNQELKLKWHSIYGQILFDRKLHEAWLQVKENKGAGGIDGETLESYEKKLDENLIGLLRKLRDKTYLPSPVRRRYIPKKNGKMHPSLYLPSSVSHVLLVRAYMSCKGFPSRLLLLYFHSKR